MTKNKYRIKYYLTSTVVSSEFVAKVKLSGVMNAYDLCTSIIPVLFTSLTCNGTMVILKVAGPLVSIPSDT